MPKGFGTDTDTDKDNKSSTKGWIKTNEYANKDSAKFETTTDSIAFASFDISSGIRKKMKHFTVAGRVQGVGFRRWAERQAEKLNLSGWVRNLSDGRVEIMAVGEEKYELTFWQACQKGPLFGKVIEMAWVSVPIATEPPVEKGIFKIVASV